MSRKPFSKMDAYTVRARIYPFLITAFPLAAAALVWLENDYAYISALWGLLIWCGGAVLFAQLGRDWGIRKQLGLYAQWGGEPTTRMLRHRDATNKVILSRWHNKLQMLCSDMKIPTESEEKADPIGADHVYEACVSIIRETTRDKNKFPLVFDELCSYGFRRNLWGMRPIGIVASVVGVTFILIYIAMDIAGKIPITKTAIIASILNLLILAGWIFLFTSSWVKIAADAYALRLLESCERF